MCFPNLPQMRLLLSHPRTLISSRTLFVLLCAISAALFIGGRTARGPASGSFPDASPASIFRKINTPAGSLLLASRAPHDSHRDHGAFEGPQIGRAHV